MRQRFLVAGNIDFKNDRQDELPTDGIENAFIGDSAQKSPLQKLEAGFFKYQTS